MQKEMATSFIINHSKLVHTDSPILGLAGPLVPHFHAFPQKALACVTFSTDVTLFLQMSHFSPTHFGRRLLLICCPCRRPLFAGGKPSAFAATQIQTQLTHRNINIILNKYTP